MQARSIAQRETAAGALVLKPLFGSQGRGLMLIRKADDLLQAANKTGVYYLQRFVGIERSGYHDFRLLVVKGRVVAAMQRHSAHWITNVKRGGRPVAVAVNDEMKTLALRAAAAVGADFAGVDIVYGADQRPSVLEVNSMPAWSGLQKVTAVNIAAVFVEALVTALAAHASARSHGVTPRAEQVAAAFKWACLAELDAPKPGNVHVFAGGHRMTADEFVRSADAAAGPLSAPGARVGARILGAVEATFAAVGANTNLGIILLCAPLAAAADTAASDLRGVARESPPRTSIRRMPTSRFAPSSVRRPRDSGTARAMTCSRRLRSASWRR